MPWCASPIISALGAARPAFRRMRRGRRIYRIAATYGHPAAQYALGVMDIKGQGVKKNRSRACNG